MSHGKRIEWVDIVKYVCIIMVMLSHLESRTDIWSAFYSPFFLTAFFFTAGYVYKPKGNFKEFLYSKFRQLFAPWFIFSVFDILLSQVLSFNAHESLVEELKWNFLQIRGQGDQIWFVAALFVTFIPFYFFIRKYETISEKVIGGGYSKKCLIAIATAWSLSFISILYTWLVPAEVFPWNSTALPWHIEYMFQAMFYMVLGFMFRHNFEGMLDRHNTLLVRIVATTLYSLIAFIPFFAKIEMPMLIDVIYQYMASFVGIFTLIMIAKKVRSNKYVNYVGQNTLIYFALHGKVYSVIQTVLKKFATGFYTAVLNNTAVSSIFCLALSLVLSVILIMPAYIINRWLPFVVGRKREKTTIRN